MSDEDLRRLEREAERRGRARFSLLTRVRVSDRSVPCRVWQGRRDWDPAEDWRWRTPVFTLEEALGIRARMRDERDRVGWNRDSAGDRVASTFSIHDAERREVLNLTEGYHSTPSVVVDGEDPSPPPSDGFGRFLADADGTCRIDDLDNNNDMTAVGLAMLGRTREATKLEKRHHEAGGHLVCDMPIGAHPCGARYSTREGLDLHQEIGHRWRVVKA